MHTRGRGCKARRSQTGLSASRGRESSPCKDGCRGGEKTARPLCTIYRSAGKTSDAARSEHCVSRRRTANDNATTTEKSCGIWESTRKRASIAHSDSENNSDGFRPSPNLTGWLCLQKSAKNANLLAKAYIVELDHAMCVQCRKKCIRLLIEHISDIIQLTPVSPESHVEHIC